MLQLIPLCLLVSTLLTQRTRTLVFISSNILGSQPDMLSFTAHTSSELKLLLTFEGHGCQTFVSQARLPFMCTFA